LNQKERTSAFEEHSPFVHKMFALETLPDPDVFHGQPLNVLM